MSDTIARFKPARKTAIVLLVGAWLGYSGALLGWWAYTTPASDICFAPRS